MCSALDALTVRVSAAVSVLRTPSSASGPDPDTAEQSGSDSKTDSSPESSAHKTGASAQEEGSESIETQLLRMLASPELQRSGSGTAAASHPAETDEQASSPPRAEEVSSDDDDDSNGACSGGEDDGSRGLQRRSSRRRGTTDFGENPFLRALCCC